MSVKQLFFFVELFIIIRTIILVRYVQIGCAILVYEP